MNLYRNEASDPKANAQRNLCGRTHYVDDDTLRWHKARVLSARATCNGLIFYVIESVAVDMHNTRRECRYVLFDVFGDVIGTRAALGEGWKRSEQAQKAMYAELNTLDPKAITFEAIKRAENYHAQEMARMRAQVAALETSAAA